MIIPWSSSRPFRKSWLEQMSKMTWGRSWGSWRDSESRLQHWILYSVLFQCEEYIYIYLMTMPFAVLERWSKKSMSAFCLRQIGTQPWGSLVRFLTLDCCRDAIAVVARGTFLTAGFTSTRATRKHSSFLLMDIDGGSEHLNQLVRISDTTRKGGSDLLLEDSQLGSVTTPQPTSPMCSQMTSE